MFGLFEKKRVDYLQRVEIQQAERANALDEKAARLRSEKMDLADTEKRLQIEEKYQDLAAKKNGELIELSASNLEKMKPMLKQVADIEAKLNADKALEQMQKEVVAMEKKYMQEKFDAVMAEKEKSNETLREMLKVLTSKIPEISSKDVAMNVNYNK